MYYSIKLFHQTEREEGMKNNIFPKILRAHRKAAGYNQAEVAKKLLISRSAYNHYETGDRIPNTETLIRIAALFNINPNDLLGTLIPPEVKSEYPGFTNTLYCGKYAFSSEDLQLTACYNSLQDEEKEMILTLMRSLGNKSAIIRQTHLY